MEWLLIAQVGCLNFGGIFGEVDMNFIKFGKSGPNLQRLNFENFEKRRSGSRWFWVVGTKDYPGELV